MSDSYALQPQANWLEKRDTTATELKSIATITDSVAYEAATAIIAAAKKLRKELEAERKAVTSRLDAAKKALIQRERDLGAALDAEIERVSGLASAYAAEEMRRREEEQRRIEAERRAAAEAAIAAQEAAAETGDPDPFGIGIDTSAIDAAAAIEAVPVPETTAKPKGVVMRLRVQVVDESRIPREFLSFDEKKALAWAKYQKSLGARVSDLRADGLRFYEEASVVSR